MKNINITNRKFNKLTATKYMFSRNGKQYWLFKCDCGNEKIINKVNVLTGKTKSCGCLLKDFIKQDKIKHGMRNTRLYYIWCNIKQRCINKNHKYFHCYGGRGITVCKEWKNDFITFYNWATQNGYNENLTIDRLLKRVKGSLHDHVTSNIWPPFVFRGRTSNKKLLTFNKGACILKSRYGNKCTVFVPRKPPFAEGGFFLKKVIQFLVLFCFP